MPLKKIIIVSLILCLWTQKSFSLCWLLTKMAALAAVALASYHAGFNVYKEPQVRIYERFGSPKRDCVLSYAVGHLAGRYQVPLPDQASLPYDCHWGSCTPQFKDREEEAYWYKTYDPKKLNPSLDDLVKRSIDCTNKRNVKNKLRKPKA